MGIDTSVRSTHILLRETSHDCCLGNWIYQKKRCCLPQWSWQRWRGELSEVWSGTLHQDEISWIFPPCGSICGSEIVPGQWRAIPGASLWHAGDALYKLLVWLLYLHTVCRVPWFQLTFHHFFFGGGSVLQTQWCVFFFLNQTFVICEPFQYHAFWTNFGAWFHCHAISFFCPLVISKDGEAPETRCWCLSSLQGWFEIVDQPGPAPRVSPFFTSE